MDMVWKLQAAVFSASKETKFEFDTISIISERHWKNNFNFSEIVNKLRVEARNSIANWDLFLNFLWNYK